MSAPEDSGRREPPLVDPEDRTPADRVERTLAPVVELSEEQISRIAEAAAAILATKEPRPKDSGSKLLRGEEGGSGMALVSCETAQWGPGDCTGAGRVRIAAGSHCPLC